MPMPTMPTAANAERQHANAAWPMQQPDVRCAMSARRCSANTAAACSLMQSADGRQHDRGPFNVGAKCLHVNLPRAASLWPRAARGHARRGRTLNGWPQRQGPRIAARSGQGHQATRQRQAGEEITKGSRAVARASAHACQACRGRWRTTRVARHARHFHYANGIADMSDFAVKPVWDKKRPKDLGKPKDLSVKKKKSAKARAKAAGRPYPNLIDNMAAARKKGK
jgi:hypothetical protein